MSLSVVMVFMLVLGLRFMGGRERVPQVKERKGGGDTPPAPVELAALLDCVCVQAAAASGRSGEAQGRASGRPPPFKPRAA
jgi:hypothetical protein